MNIKLSTGIYLFLLLMLGKFIALVKDIALSSFYGVSWQADAFFVANGVPILVFSAFYSTIPLIFLPTYNKIRIDCGKPLSYDFVNKFINIYFLIALVLSCFSIYYSSNIVALIAPGLPENTRDLSINLAQIFSLSFVFTVVVGVFTSMQHVNKFFMGSQLIPIINNTLVILSIIFLSKYFGLKVVAFFAVFSWLLQIPIQRYFVDKNYSYEFYIDFKDKNIKMLFILFFPTFGSTLIAQSNALVDIYLASELDVGTVAALNYASRLMMLVSLLFPVVITTIMYPYFSDFITTNKFQKLNVSIEKSIKIILLLTVPLLIFFTIFNVEVIRMIFERGEFNANATMLTANVFLFYSLAILFIALREVFNKVYYAMEKPKLVLYISSFSVLLNVVLSFVLVKKFNAEGLAMATSISVFFHVVVQFFLLKKILGSRFYRKTFYFFIKIFISSMIMVLVLKCLHDIQFSGIFFLNVIITFIVSVSLYIISLYLLKQREICFFTHKFLSLFR